jgi:hypothetical protein
MIRRAVAIISVLGLADTAHAEAVAPPSGWTIDRDRTQRLAVAPHLGGAPAAVELVAYRPATAGAMLYVTRSEAAVGAAQRDQVATRELAELATAMDSPSA